MFNFVVPWIADVSVVIIVVGLPRTDICGSLVDFTFCLIFFTRRFLVKYELWQVSFHKKDKLV